MWIRSFAVLATLSVMLPLAAQSLGRDGRNRPGSTRDGIGPTMPDGRSRALLILKKEVEKSTDDMARVIELATELQTEIETNQFHTVDIRSVRKAEEIIKIVRRVKGRMSRSR